jgi:cell division transport system permease protein
VIFQQAKYFAGVAANSLWQYRTRNIFSVTIISLSFLIIGIFLSLANNLQHLAGELSANMVVTFFLEKDVRDADRTEIERKIRAFPVVTEVKSVGAAEALEKFRVRFPELGDILVNLKDNPFPPSLEARIGNAQRATADVTRFIEEIRRMKGVEDVRFNREWVDRMRSLGRLAQAVGLFLGGILVLASFFIISNVIKLNVMARKNEIEILRLVGAGNGFIRVPFLLEGMALGALGSLISLVVLFLVIKLFPVYVGSLGALQEILSFRYLTLSQSLGIVAAGAIIGILGSAGSVSRFIRV